MSDPCSGKPEWELWYDHPRGHMQEDEPVDLTLNVHFMATVYPEVYSEAMYEGIARKSDDPDVHFEP